MRAIVQAAYGGVEVLSLAEIPRPKPAPDEVLIKVRATSVHPDVWHVMTGVPYVLRLMGSGLRRPKNTVPGTDLAGTVEAVGAKVTRFKAGDDVFGETLRGMQWVNGGAWAEYAVAPEFCLALKPTQVSFETAAAVPTAGLIALFNLRDQGRFQSGQGKQVLINGAAGGVGSMTLQLAKALGATVTAVDRADKLDFLRALGADHVIDYAKTDFTLAGERYDLIFDIPGNHSFNECKRALKPDGVWVIIGHDNYGQGSRWLGEIPRMLGLMLRANFDPQLPRPSFKLPEKQGEMEFLRQNLESGRLAPPIDRVFPLAQAAEAVRYLQSGAVKGKILVSP